MKIGLLDVDGHNFPNVALMKIADWHRLRGDDVEWAMPMFGEYDRIYASKVFTFTHDFDTMLYKAKEIVRGGTGYDIKSRLPDEIDRHTGLAYDFYAAPFQRAILLTRLHPPLSVLPRSR